MGLNPLSLVTGALGGVWGYVAALGVGAALATGATYEIVHNANAVEIADLKTNAANQKAANVTAALQQLTGFIANIHIAEVGYGNDLAGIDARFAAIEKGLQNAFKKPLPVGCKPDDARVREYTAAIAATNAEITAAPP